VQIIVGKCGGNPEQAAAGLAIAIYVPFTVFGNSVQGVVGTLTAQALGACETKTAGERLLTGLGAIPLVGTLCCVSCIIITPSLVSLATGNNNLRSLAAEFTPVFAWSAFLFQLYGVMRAWFQAQKVTAPFIFSGSIGLACNVCIGYLLACESGGIGWTGAAIGIVGAGAVQLLAVIAWARISKGDHHLLWARAECRPAFKRDRVVELGKMLVYRGLWTTLDEGACMVISLMVGQLGTAKVATQSVYFLLWSLLYSVQLGLFTSVNVRVSHQLGAGSAQNAKNAALSGLIAFGVLTVVGDGMLFLTPVAQIFSKDAEVRAIIDTNLPALAVCIAATSAQAATFAPLSNSADDLKKLTWIVAISAWSVGLPVAYFLGFGPRQILGVWLPGADLGLSGVWLGIACGEASKALAAGWVLFRFDWGRAVDKVQAQLNRPLLK